MAEILHFDGVNYGSEPPESTLEKAKGWGMMGKMIILYLAGVFLRREI